MTWVLIDRATLEQLVVALNEVDQHVDLKRYHTAPDEQLFDVVMAAMVKGRAALANAEPAGWISVSDRVPQEEERVLIFSHGHPSISVWWKGEFIMPSSVQPTHWMPLPPSPGYTL